MSSSNYQNPISTQNKKHSPSDIFFFNSPSQVLKMHRTGELRGCKLKSKDEDKLITLRTRYVEKANFQKLRVSLNQEDSIIMQEQHQQQQLRSYREQRPRYSLDSLRYRSMSKKLPSAHKNIQPQHSNSTNTNTNKIQQQSNMIITSKSNSLPKSKKIPRQIPQFQSANLQGKMNDYLNLIIRKSHEVHHQKLKKILQPDNSTNNNSKEHKVQNMYYRRMKISLNKRKQQKKRDQSLFGDAKTVSTIEILHNLKRIGKKSSLSHQQQQIN